MQNDRYGPLKLKLRLYRQGAASTRFHSPLTFPHIGHDIKVMKCGGFPRSPAFLLPAIQASPRAGVRRDTAGRFTPQWRSRSVWSQKAVGLVKVEFGAT
ncbi:hypothetical protein LDENG_00153840 [Lucifuga dentata]|nr:hypothetical protein LDENG_00153840 [Lucifuga dentata]